MASQGNRPLNNGTPKLDSLSTEQYRRLRDIFDHALERPIIERADYVRAASADDPTLQSELLGLLAAADAVGNRLMPGDGTVARQLLSPAGQAPGVPTQIGPYRIDRLLGEGGMGAVYLAQQTTPARQIALKILRNVTGSRTLLARFAREIRALGRLEHPGIARIYEAGSAATPSGDVQYFAMEYVAGSRITDYAARFALNTAARVELVAKVADAVQHAHTKGVIHRDLKPANILIASDTSAPDAPTAGALPAPAASHDSTRTRSPDTGGQPKVLDFGVARLMDAGADHTQISETGSLLGTIAYMSPEQLRGDADAIDTRADVYSMGVILIELLTGELPHPVRGKSLAEASRLLTETEAAPLNHPSASAAGRFPRDLEIIVAHALAREPDRRYLTAAAFADDLRRFLRNEPILARTPSTAYQLSRFARRHRALVLGTAATAIALVGGLVVSGVLLVREREARSRADQNARLAVAVQGYMVEGLLMAAAPNRMGHDVKMLDVLSHAADGLHERFADEPEVELEIRTQLAEVLFSVGEFQKSVDQWQQVVPMAELLFGSDDPRTIRAILSQSRAALQLKQMRTANNLAKEASLRAGRALPDRDATRIATILLRGQLAIQEGQFRYASDVLTEAARLAQDNPDASEALRLAIAAGLNECQQRRGTSPDPVSAAQALLEQAQATSGTQSPASITAQSNLLLAYLRAGRAVEALPIAESLPAAAEQALAPNHVGRGHAYRNAASVMAAAGRWNDAEQLALKSWDVFRAVFTSPNAEHDLCADQLRAIYAAWTGHEAQLRTWGVRAIAYRLGHTPRGRWFAVTRAYDSVAAEQTNARNPTTVATLMELVWAEHAHVVPPGDPLRAMFMANYACLAARVGHDARYDEAVAIAEAEAAASTNTRVAGGPRPILGHAAKLRAATKAGGPAGGETGTPAQSSGPDDAPSPDPNDESGM